MFSDSSQDFDNKTFKSHGIQLHFARFSGISV